MYFNYTFGALHIYDNYQNVQKLFPAKNWLGGYPPVSKIVKKTYNGIYLRNHRLIGAVVQVCCTYIPMILLRHFMHAHNF
jgi:hypothetical protein